MGFRKERQRFEYYVAARYPGQLHDLTITLPRSRVSSDLELTNIFHETHHRKYSVCRPDTTVDFVGWTVIGTGIVDKFTGEKQLSRHTDVSKALKERRQVYFLEMRNMVDIPVYGGNKLVNGNVIKDPAIVEDVFSTPVIPPWAIVTVTEAGDYYMELP